MHLPPDSDIPLPPEGADPNESFFEGGASARVDFEGEPLTRSEYITAMVHLYRGELYRTTAWRIRLDNTTNWAIISVGGLLTFAFGHPDSPPLVLLFGQALLFAFLWVESRRYRWFDVWRSRLRKIEENFYGPLLMRRLPSPDPLWGDAVAHDLSHPLFKLSRWHAMHHRLRANYAILFVILGTAWAAKLFLHPEPTDSLAVALDRLSEGLVVWPVMAGAIVAFWALLVAIWVIPGKTAAIRGRKWGLDEDRILEESR